MQIKVEEKGLRCTNFTLSIAFDCPDTNIGPFLEQYQYLGNTDIGPWAVAQVLILVFIAQILILVHPWSNISIWAILILVQILY